MPPIPEDAVVLADYMLMADYVKQTDVEPTEISKGVRYCSGSRDHFCDVSGGTLNGNVVINTNSQYGLTGGKTPDSPNTASWKLPFFGTTGQACVEAASSGQVVKLGGATATKTLLASEAGGDNENNQITISGNTNGDVTLGLTNIETTGLTGSNRFYAHHVVTPIHTSSHYQTFETPFLHELVGGDRNMEQTNLVVTPDGKTWDEVTRDVSYIGNVCVSTTENTDFADATVIFTEWRGNDTGDDATYDLYNKDFAIAYDRLICLKDGAYTISAKTIEDTVSYALQLYLNGTAAANLLHRSYQGATGFEGHSYSMTIPLKRGDYLITKGGWHGNTDYSRFEITKG
jgi:hypothetical protein